MGHGNKRALTLLTPSKYKQEASTSNLRRVATCKAASSLPPLTELLNLDGKRPEDQSETHSGGRLAQQFLPLSHPCPTFSGFGPLAKGSTQQRFPWLCLHHPIPSLGELSLKLLSF